MLSCADSQPKNSIYANAYKKQKSHVECKSSPELTLIDIQWAWQEPSLDAVKVDVGPVLSWSPSTITKIKRSSILSFVQ